MSFMRKIILATMFGLTLSLWAQEDFGTDELSLGDLMDLALQTGSFLDLDLRKSPLSMTIITQEQVAYSGARHLTELLEIYVPGFQYMYNKWNGEIWGMRGVAADRNTKFLFLVNGHKMNHESRDGAMSELSLGLLGDIERVEILRGPAGLVYGSGAIAGIVNIVTKRYEEEKTVVRSGLGTWDFSGTSREVGADVYHDLGDNSNLVFSMGYRSSDGIAAEEARLWGRPHWPYPQWLGNNGQSSVPAAGCAWCTPGNWRVSMDYNIGKLRIYSRVTHQVGNAGGMFIVDPWPMDVGNIDTSTNTAWVDGKLVTKFTPTITIDSNGVSDTTWSTSWWGSTESGDLNRRQYVVDNVMIDMNYDWELGRNTLKLKAGFDGVTNRIQRENRRGYESTTGSERTLFIDETFGEKRYSLGGTYLLNSIDKLQAAFGYEIRRDDIGDDLTGKNMSGEKSKHYVVSDVTYYNNAIFSEAFYEVNRQLFVHGGLRYDLHTRTQNVNGIVSPKIAMIVMPTENHSFKFIYQSSSNNGSADNYEYNRNNIDDNGVPYTEPHYEKPTSMPDGHSTIIPGVTLSELHRLKPEQVRSLEFASVNRFDALTIQPSASYNKVSNLFNWNQAEFRVINAGEYDFINLELEASLEMHKLKLGASHTYQRIVNMDLADLDVVTVTDNYGSWISYQEDGITKYKPIKTGTLDTTTINAIRAQITVDGENFLNLATHLSKLYVDYRLLPSLLLHSDLRVFWGLAGRSDLIEQNPGFDYLHVDTDPICKWNASVHWLAGKNTRVSLYAYDLLASETGTGAIHSLRWQQAGNSAEHTDLYGLDRRSFAVMLEQTF